MLKTVLKAGFTAVFLAGCGSVTPAGMIAAARLDPLQTPPGDISVAVGVPKVLRLSDGDAVLRLAYVTEDADARGVDVTVPLSVVEDAGASMAQETSDAVTVFGFAPEDVDRLAAAQAQIRALKAQEIEGKGSLSVAVVGGCLTGAMGDALPVSTWLRTDPGAAFVPLTRRADLLRTLPEAERRALTAGLGPC